MTRPASLALYAAAARALDPLAPAWLAARARRGKEDPARLGERLGRPSQPRPAGPLAWLHGASVGEGLSLLPIAEGLRALAPDLNLLVTTGTRSSAELLASRLPAGAIHQYAPLDSPVAARRFHAHWRPDLAVFVESELWPNLIGEAKAAGAGLALVSARMSAASFARWRRFPGAARALLADFDLVLARDAAMAARFSSLGGEVAGVFDAKLGAAPLPGKPAAEAALRPLFGGAILGASTHPGEEALILEAFAAAAAGRPDARLVIVPRHPERGPEVKALAEAAGFSAGLRSAGESGARVLVADTLGELGLFFRLARLAVIGGSFAAGVGGHNPLEPARLCCAFVAGPHVEHWPIYEAFLAEAAMVRCTGAPELALRMGEALDGADWPAQMAAKALALAARLDGESARLAPRLLKLIGR